MSIEEHVTQIEMGSEAWNAWRRVNRSTRPDLSGANIIGARLSGADLRGANLSGANLSGTSLSGAKLYGANLIGAKVGATDLIRANLKGANLSRANFNQANLRVAILTGAVVRDADLSEANLGGADLGSADLRGTNLNAAILVGAYLSRANLSGADLSGADLTGANFKWAKLGRANLHRANLSRARFGNADLNGADLSGADLSEADLFRADLSSADLTGTDLRGTDFSTATIGYSSFGNNDLSQTIGLETVYHIGPSTIGVDTIYKSNGKIPEIFLRGAGVPEEFIVFVPSLVGRAIEFFSCFISYSHVDKGFARRLYDALQGRGIRCWLDEHQLLPGDKLYTEIDRGIRLWDKVLLCCSKDSLTSWWVDNEIKISFDKEQRLWREQQKEVLVLIPLDIDEHLFSDKWQSGLATEVKSRLAARFNGWEHDNEKFEEQFERLVKALRTNSGGKEPPPTALL